ncbi:4-oxalocrotonate tautomerase family protein [Actinomycetospora rhizophila]|uniref:4-oxalocrotonate tautomerase family protein n=1 Tax=Actinomycetospora rhizophila TaxID=1416876 RepID=A0ABV9ZD95_9PSEU
MPVLELHLVDGDHAPDEHARLLELLSRRYAEVLESPLERVRAYLTLHAREHWAVGGSTGAAPAPYFTAIVLEGRPVEQRHRLLAEVTDLIVGVLGVERSRVRGRIIQVPPDDWAIGGVPASGARRDEIAARAAATGSPAG